MKRFTNTLRPLQQQDSSYRLIQVVPFQHEQEVDIADVPADVRETILAESPACTSVRVGMFTRKGMEFLSYTGWGGTRDGFPVVTVRI